MRKTKVNVSTYRYEFEAGKQARGFGHWAFVAKEKYNAEGYLDHVKWFTGNYGDAKRLAMDAFRAAGVTEVVLCS